ncbi:hypothetical protein KJ693_03385 [bacterium]|nr:hypothetical protein [bacterium]MBU1614335.1 hypothetical protein [bacterium]
MPEERQISNKTVCFQLKERLKHAALANLADGMLFSGGLDTSILRSITITTRYTRIQSEIFQNL